MSAHKSTRSNVANACRGFILILAAALALASAGRTLADPVPPVLGQPNVPVFCFRITDISRVAGDPGNDRFRFEFEALNWTNDAAFGIYVALNEGTGAGAVIDSPPFFAGAEVDSDGRPLVLLDVNGNGVINATDLEDTNTNGLLDPGEDKNGNGRLDNDPIPGNLNPPNNWSVAPATATAITWDAGTPLPGIDLLGLASGTPLLPGDLAIDFMEFTDPANASTVITETIDNGPNVQDGFVIEVDDFDPGEVLSFNWFLLNSSGGLINFDFGEGGTVTNPMAFGVVNLAHLAGDVFPSPVFVGNTGFSQAPVIFFDSVYVVPNPASFAAEFGAALTATFQNPADNLFGISVTTHFAITVNTTADELNSDGDCSLREAITAANTDTAVDACIAGSGADTIGFSVTGTIISTVTPIDIIDDLTIAGPGAANLTLTDNIPTVLHALRLLAVDNGVTLNVQGLTVADTGGISNSGTLIVTNSTFSGNRVNFSNGGAILGGTVIVENSIFSGNSIGAVVCLPGVLCPLGGAIAADTVTVTNSTFSGNSAGGGGAIYGNTVTVANSTFSGNSGRGGGIYNNSGALTITDSTFSDNQGDSGGAIFNFGFDGIVITNSTFTNNSASFSGGAIFEPNSGATVMNSTFSDNHAGDSGGAIFVREPVSLDITGSTFSGNSAGAGGAIENVGGGLTVMASTFSSNSAITGYGGGINHTAGGGGNVTNSTFSGNSAALGGGGIFNDGFINITNSTFSGNSATDGGGIFNAGGFAAVNITLSGNNATRNGGGIFNSPGRRLPSTITNATFYGNGAGSGGGIFFEDVLGVPLTLTNTIVAHSISGGNCDGPAQVVDGGNNLQFPGATCGASIPTADPLLGPLQDNGGPTLTHALLPSSLAIDAVPLADCTDVSTDQRSVTRPQGAACDIGAFELTTQLIVIKHVVNDNGGTATAADFTMNVTGTNVNPASFPGEESPGTMVALDAGNYNVTESGPSGYTATFDGCSGTIAVGESKTCIVTSDDISQLPPDLVIAKSNDQDTVQAGQTLIYTLTIGNVGGQMATGVMVSDTLLAHTTFIAASDGGSASSGLVTWPAFDLAAGASVTRTLTVRVNDDMNSAPVRDTRTWRRSGRSIAFSTPEHYSGCGSATITTITNTATVADDGAHGLDPTPEDNTASDTDEVTGSEVIFTTGVPDNWSLQGWVRVQYVMDTQRILVREYQISQTGNLALRVAYPPVSQWPVMSNGVALIHVDLSISVYDDRGRLVRGVGGDQRRAPGTLGPGGQDWGVWCRVAIR